MRRLLLPLALTLTAAPALAQEPFQRSITVSASGEAEATPDRAILPVTLEHRDKSLNAAKKKNDDQAAKLLKVTESFGIKQEKLRTSGLNIRPEYQYDKPKPVFTGYAVSRSIEITLDDLEKLEKLIAALTEAGVDQMQGMDFTIANPDSLESVARKQAIDKAKAKAQEAAAAAGAKLGKVLTIGLSGDSYIPHPPMPMRAMKMEMASASAVDSAPPPLPGTLKVQQSVNITYELE